MKTNEVNVPMEASKKILAFALSQKFTSVGELAAITEVINATPNAQVAALILLGLYEMPEINVTERTTVPANSLYPTGKIVSFKGILSEYDKFTNKVKFSYELSVNKSRWFPTKDGADEYNESGRIGNGWGSRSDENTFEGNYTTSTSGVSECSLEHWLNV